MRFEELLIIFSNNCGLDLDKAESFKALLNICIDGTADKSNRNRFYELDSKSTRFYEQYHKDTGYQVSKFRDTFKKITQGNLAAFIDGLNAEQKSSIDLALKTSMEFYRYTNNGTKLSVGGGFERLLLQFLKQRTSKVDPGVSSYFPFKSEKEAVIAKLDMIGVFSSYNLFILRPEEQLDCDRITLSRMNAPRVELCVPKLKIEKNEEWISNLGKLKNVPAIFFHTDPEDYNRGCRSEEKKLPTASGYAYVGYIVGEPVQVNFKDVNLKYKKIGKLLLKELVDNRKKLGIEEFYLPNFFYGCHEGTFEKNYEDTDGYWMPDDVDIIAADEKSEELDRVKVDEFTMYPGACPMWTIKSVNLARALELSEINIELCK